MKESKCRKRWLWLFVLVSLSFIRLEAQTVTGNVVDETGQPVVFANVVLLDADSVFINGGMSTENGYFELPIDKNAKRLKISYVGYQEAFLPVNESGGNVGTIQLGMDTHLLNEVVVKGDLPKTRLKGDALVTTVSGSLLEKSGTAVDVLSKIPGIVRKGEDLNVFGRGEPMVYINGREVRDPSELDQLTSENIRSVEVITNPGARYDKTVKAVIRIQTKKRADDGFGFADRAYGKYNDNWSYGNQLDLFYHQGKWDVTALLSYSDLSSDRQLNLKQLTYLDDLWDQSMQTEQQFLTRELTAKMTLNYVFNPNHSLGASYRFRRYPKMTNQLALQTLINRGNSPFEQSEGDVDSRSQETRHEGNLYYNGDIKGWNIDFNGTWLRTEDKVHVVSNDVSNRFEEESIPLHSSVHTYTNTRNLFYASRLAVSYPLWEGSLSFGGEYTYTSRKSLYTNEEGIVDNDDSRIKESLAAGFVEYGRSFGPVALQAGVRFENIDFDYYQNDRYQSEQSKVYSNWFPALSMTLPVAKTEWQLSYSSDISRPTYQMLRNRVDYINAYTYESGNPFLMPSLTHTVALTGTYKWWQLYVDFQRNKDVFIATSRTLSEDNPLIAVMSTENAPSYNTVNAMLNASPVIGCWSPQFSVGVYKQWYEVDAPGQPGVKRSLNKPSFNANWKNGLRLPFGFILNADIYWNGLANRDNISYKAVWWADASLYKEVLDGKLSFLLQANDLFNSYKNHYFMYYGRLRTTDMEERFSYRNIGLTIRYKFNMKKNNYKGTGAGSTQRARL